MKKGFTLFLALCLLLSQSITAFAVEEDKQADVIAKAVRTANGIYPEEIDDDTAVVITDDGITITVTDVPDGAVRLVVVPVPKSEKEAWKWITACLEGTGTPIHTFDIYFEDAAGNRISANGAKVTIDCSYCSGTPKICSLSTGGKVHVLGDSAQGAAVTFTTDGSTYYVIADKTPADHPGDSDTPQTGDNINLGLLVSLMLSSVACLFVLIISRKRLVG